MIGLGSDKNNRDTNNHNHHHNHHHHHHHTWSARMLGSAPSSKRIRAASGFFAQQARKRGVSWNERPFVAFVIELCLVHLLKERWYLWLTVTGTKQSFLNVIEHVLQKLRLGCWSRSPDSKQFPTHPSPWCSPASSLWWSWWYSWWQVTCSIMVAFNSSLLSIKVWFSPSATWSGQNCKNMGRGRPTRSQGVKG